VTTDPTARAGRGPLTRRGLLAGAAGLAAGVGGTQAVHSLAGGNDAAAALRPPSPGEELMTEHGVLKRILLVYRTAADQLAAGAVPPVDAVVDAARLVYDYVESFHEGLEEAYVFPWVRDAHPDLVRTLLIQHDRGRHLTARIYRAGDLDLTRADARDRLRIMLGQFVRMYEPHEAWEDTVIYPALRRSIPQRELDLLAERFADLENSHYGDAALQQVLDRVTGIEEQLGVADLAAFTPGEGGGY
jgi:hemerythrin-like domain-containing protein